MTRKIDVPVSNSLLDAIQCHRPILISVANGILGCRHLAEDVVQDAAVKACQIGEGSTLDCPLRFSCSMVRNLAIDRARRCNLEKRYAAPLAQADELPAPWGDAARTLEAKELLARVLQTLGALPDRTRLVFWLHRIHGIPQNAIARQLGLSPPLVNDLIRRAHRHCQTVLGGDLPIAAVPETRHPRVRARPARHMTRARVAVAEPSRTAAGR